MSLKTLIALALALLAMPAFAQTPAPATATAPVRVALTTTMGRIVIELETARAPITTANFLRYVDARRYDGVNFFRAMTIAPGQGLIQAGIRDPRRLYPPIAHEPTTRTGLSHIESAVSMARHAPGTAQSDFTIQLQNTPFYDAHPEQPGDNAGYAVFGRVIEGMDVVRRIHASPISATEGEGVMRGQILSPPIRIVTARRVPAAAPAG
jgi:peptidyl-prolyl cis-trans isomerase A (cyclophilin A)